MCIRQQAKKEMSNVISILLNTYRDHLENISAGVRRLYLFSSLSMPPIGGSLLSNGLRLLATIDNIERLIFFSILSVCE